MNFAKQTRVLALGVALLGGCGPSLADELEPPAGGDTECHLLPDAVNARFPEVAKTYALQLAEKSRTLTIGIDSANRVRVLTAGVHQKRGTTLTVRMAGVVFNADGTMSKASRTLTTGDVESKGASSNAMPMLPPDTLRARVLATVALQRCVKQ